MSQKAYQLNVRSFGVVFFASTFRSNRLFVELFDPQIVKSEVKMKVLFLGFFLTVQLLAQAQELNVRLLDEQNRPCQVRR